MIDKNIFCYLKKEFKKEEIPSVKYALYDIILDFQEMKRNDFLKKMKKLYKFLHERLEKNNNLYRAYYYEKQISVLENLFNMINGKI